MSLQAVRSPTSSISRHKLEIIGTMKSTTPHTAGIYRILCVLTGKFYIGSATDIPARWHNHRLALRGGRHKNPHLQAAWNLYGEDSFAFTILEIVKRHELLAAEQKWLDRTRCTDSAIGFNIYPIAGSPGDQLAKTWHGFIDPTGNEVTISNLSEFCRLHNLDHPSMIRLAQGKSKLKSHKGWTHKNSVRKRPYTKTYDVCRPSREHRRLYHEPCGVLPRARA